MELLAGRGLFSAGPPWHGPVYPLFLAVVYRFLGPDPWMAYWVQALLGGASAWACAALARRQGAPAWAGGLAAALAWPLIHPAAQLVPPVLEVFLLCLAWLALLPGRPGACALSGALFALTALSRQQALLALPAGAWALGRNRSAAAFLAGALAVLGAWLGCVKAATGDWVAFAPTGGLNFCLALEPGATGEPLPFPGLHWMELRQEPLAQGCDSLAEQDRFLYEKAAGLAAGSLPRSFGLWLRRAALVAAGREPFTRVAPDWLGPFPALGFALLFGLGLAGLLIEGGFLWRANLAFVLLSWLALSLTIVTGRYRAILLPSLCLGAAAFALRLGSASRLRPLLLAAGLVLFSWSCGLLVRRPGDADLGVAMAMQARFGGPDGELARGVLERARAQRPEDLELAYHQAQLELSLGRWDEAEAAASALAEARGRAWPGAWGLAADLRAARGDWSGALAAARRRAALDPRSLDACMDVLLWRMTAELDKGAVPPPSLCLAAPRSESPGLRALAERYARPGADPADFGEALSEAKVLRIAAEHTPALASAVRAQLLKAYQAAP